MYLFWSRNNETVFFCVLGGKMSERELEVKFRKK